MAQNLAPQTGQGGRMATRKDFPLERLRPDFDTLFGRLLGGWLAPFEQDFGAMRMWDFDVKENDKEIVVRAEMPGFEANELDVQLNNDVLTIKAEKEQKGERQEEYRSFYRTITLPAGIDAEKVQANYRNGVLELHIPRAPGAQPRHIAIQGAQPATGRQGQQAASGQSGVTASSAGNQGQPGSAGQSEAAASAKAGK